MTATREAPAATVIVVSFNTRGRLVEALDSLVSSRGVDFETVVVDNASNDGSPAAAAAHPLGPRVVSRATNGGFAAGVNNGTAVARGEFLVLLNSDARLKPDALARLVDYLRRRPGVGTAGGRLVNPDGTRQATAFREPTLLDSWLEFGFPGGARPRGMRLAPDVTGAVDWVSGAFLAFPRSVAARLGGFDERFFMYAEDIDWGRRVRAAGLEVHYVTEAEAVHEARGSDPADRRWSPRSVASRLRYHARHQGRPAALLLRAALTFNWLVLLLLALPVALLPAGPGVRARRALPLLPGLIVRAGEPSR